MQLKDLLIQPKEEVFQLLAVVEKGHKDQVVVLNKAASPVDLQPDFLNYLHDEESLEADVQYELISNK